MFINDQLMQQKEAVMTRLRGFRKLQKEVMACEMVRKEAEVALFRAAPQKCG